MARELASKSYLKDNNSLRGADSLLRSFNGTYTTNFNSLNEVIEFIEGNLLDAISEVPAAGLAQTYLAEL